MFSLEFYQSENLTGCGTAVLEEEAWEPLCTKYNFRAALLVHVNIGAETFKLVSSYGVPFSPFNGSERVHLETLLADCFKRYAKPHVHSLHGHQIANIIPRLSSKVGQVNRVVFAPVTAQDTHYILLAFPQSGDKRHIEVDDVIRDSKRILCLITHLNMSKERADRLSVAELFVKEIGHDIASSVQAIIAKVRTIRDGRISDLESIKRKALEIEQETNSAFGIADMLGLAMDPNYGLRSYVDFDAVRIVNSAADQLSGEAQERHIKIEVSASADWLKLWGDERAIQQCVWQILMNAIKYSHGGTTIKVNIVNRSDAITYQIINNGLELPKGQEANDMWEFGVRGAKAKELHVNGSGVGLYTVRKIVRAHRGRVWADGSNGHNTFSFEIPKRDRLKKELGILI